MPVAELLSMLPATLERRDRTAVNSIVFALLEQNAPIGRQWRSLAAVMSQNGEHSAAIGAIRRYVAAEAGGPIARLDEVFTLQRAGRVSEARDVLCSIPRTIPDRAQYSYLLGALDSMLGKIDDARENLTAAVQMGPDNGQAWLALAMLGRSGVGDKIGDALVDQDPRRQDRKMRHADAYFYGLGKVLAERGEHAAAFDAFSEGARLCAAAQPYDADADKRRVEQIKQGFERSFIDRISAKVSVDTSRPIIATGNPRSGTTLVEQILASHSEVTDGGELECMRIVAQDIGGPLEGDLSRYLAGGQANDLARLYLHLVDERFGPKGRVVDKRLFASRTLGLVAAILPQAPIIWLRRDPLDCAWSCFRTYFNQSSPWSHDLATIASHFRQEDGLLALWQERLGERLLVVPYEELVESPEVWTRRLLEHCKLPEERQVFAPHEHVRPVMTASVMQVREPINKKGIGVAEPYRKFMQPFIEAYYG